MNIMDKRAETGSEMIIWIYRLVLVGLVLLILSIIVLNLYSIKGDVRKYEAIFIGERVAECISNNGVINMDSFSKASAEKCTGIDDKNMDVYVSITLSGIGGEKIDGFGIGRNDLMPLCEYDVSCSNQNYYFLLDDGMRKSKLNLLVAIDKIQKNS